MRKALAVLGATAVAVGVWACSDVREPSSIVDVEPLQSHIGVPCDLSDVESAARAYLGNPYQQQAVTRIGAIEADGCGGAADEQLAWEVLNIIEKVANDGVGDDPVDGVAVVDGMVHCCLGDDFVVSPEVLAVGGLFGVRGAPVTLPYPPTGNADAAPVLSRDPVRLMFRAAGADPVARPAIIGLRPRGGSWAAVANGSPGTSMANVLALTGFGIDGLTFEGLPAFEAYELDEIPDFGLGAQVDVIACFTDGGEAGGAPPDPHPEGESYLPKIRRSSATGGILLQEVTSANAASFCNTYVTGTQSASSGQSALERLARFAGDLLMPEPLAAFAAALSDRTSISFGGGASFFSKFKLSNADSNGQLAFLAPVPMPAIIRKNQQFTVQVSAKDGDGSPAEVTTLLTLKNNNGTPGFFHGTFTNCEGQVTVSPPEKPAVGCTVEVADPGAGGVATYQVSIPKTGAYIMCVTAIGEGFNFPEVCTTKFNVRN